MAFDGAKTTESPRLLILSHVLPFPGSSGQQRRVFNKLKALQKHFHLTFLTITPAGRQASLEQQLLELCDEVIFLPSRHTSNFFRRALNKLSGIIYSLITGLKSSNYLIQKVQFTPRRIAEYLKDKEFDGVLFEYWHASENVSLFHNLGIPCILDMHNVLWQSYSRQLSDKWLMPAWWRKRAIQKYQTAEESSWKAFDALIAITVGEKKYTEEIVGDSVPVFYAPMGIDLSEWEYSWLPSAPYRFAYYGGLGSPHNQQSALQCYHEIMPLVWESYPEAQLWLVGSNPPDSLHKIAETDSRVIVTGFVEGVQVILKTMTGVLCPWIGTYGFRSRLIEVMALGIPVIATSDAVYGMNVEVGKGLFLRDENEGMASACTRLIADPEFAQNQSRYARMQIEEKYSFEATYGQLAHDILAFVNTRK